MKSDRFEKKYMISKPQAEILRMSLRSVCRLDQDGKYWVRSLYFDTVMDDDRHDKLIGIPDRKKVRLRIYSLKSDTAKLEVKRKHYERVSKISVPIQRDTAEGICRGDLDADTLPESDQDIAYEWWELYNQIRRPALIIDYYREAYCFEDSDVRITFDTDIYASDNTALYESQTGFPLFEGGRTVLEIKYDGHLPGHIKSILNSVDLTPVSVSKYCIGRKLFA